MLNKNDFLKSYLQIPDKAGIRRFVRAIFILINFFNFGMIYLFYKVVVDKPISNFTLLLFVIAISVFDFWSLIMIIFPEKLTKQFHLYTSIAFVGSSLLYIFIADNIFHLELDSMLFLLITGISIMIYIIVIISVIINVGNKIKNNCTKRHNKQFAGIIISLGVAIGIILAKQTKLGNIPLAIMMLILSYSLAFTCSGFHKFYLLMKE